MFMSIFLQCQKHFLRSGCSENRYCQFIDWNCIYTFSITFVQTCISNCLIKIINSQCLSLSSFIIRRSMRIGSLLRLYSGFNSSRSISSWNSSPAAAQNAGCHWSLSGAFFKLLPPVCVNHDSATSQFVFCARMLSFHLFSFSIFPPQSFPVFMITYLFFSIKQFLASQTPEIISSLLFASNC